MRKIKFKAWLKKAKKSKSLIFLSALGILILVVFLVSPLHSAASTFRANWDSGSLNADYAIGSKTAQNDGTPAEIVNPGYGGAGGAVKASAGQTLKYELADSLDKEKGEIEMKFKLPYDLGGDHSTGKVNRPNGVDYDSSSGYIYIADSENNRIVKTKIDGTGWTTFGSEGSGAGEFSRPVGIHYDSATDYLYILDNNNYRIVKTQMDGTGWTTYGSSGSGTGQFNLHYERGSLYYDSASDYIYVADHNNHRVVKTKIDGTGWTTYGSNGSGVGQFTYLTGVFYDSGSEYLYISDRGNHRIVKTQIDGTGWTTYGSNGSGVGQFKSPNNLCYDSGSDFIYVADMANSRIVKTQIDGTGWTTNTNFSWVRDVCYNSSDSYLYVVDQYANGETRNRVIKTKIDDSGRTTYGYYGKDKSEFMSPLAAFFDSVSGNIYTIDYTASITRTAMDGSNWDNYGSRGSGTGEFYFQNDRAGIYYDSASGYIYVADRFNHRVVKTKMDGTGWTVKTGFNQPADVYYDAASEYLYVVEIGSDRIVKTQIDGTGWTTYGGLGSGVGQFKNPRGVYYDSATEFIYVADTTNDRIVKTKMGGTGWTTYGSTGSGAGQFNLPYGVCYDSTSDFIYVADRENNRIVKTKVDGEGWTTYGGSGSGVGQFNDPSSIHYDSATDYLYVIDRINNRIVKTQIDGTGWTTFGGDPTKNFFTTSGANPMWLNVSPWDGRFRFYISQGGIAYETKSDPQTLSQDTWHTIKAIYNNSTGETELLLDSGSLVSETFLAWSEPDLGSYFYVGSDPDYSSRALNNSIDEFRLTSINADADPPTNPTGLVALNEEGGGTSLTTDNWYNYPKPYFSWSGALDPGSGIQGYLVYFGTDQNADPETEGTFQTGTTYKSDFDLTNAETYYLRIKTRDYAYNVSSTTWAPFNYKYDNDKPTQVEYINVDPDTPSPTQDFSFDWPQATDPTSGVKEYVYKVGSGGTEQTVNGTSLSGIAPYQEGDNVLFLKPRDYAGNTPDNWQTAIFISTAPVQVIDGPDVDTKSSYVTVNWISSKNSTGYVLVHKGDQFISEQGHTDLSKNHEVRVVGLDPETDYRYKLRTIDANGNIAESGWYQFKTAAPPRVSGVKVEDVRQTTAQVSWKTSVPATSKVNWGTSASYGQSATETTAPNYVSSHSYKLTGLTPDLVYHLKIKAGDEDNVLFYSSDYTFTTPPYPTISGVKFEPVEDQPTTTLKIAWTTNIPTSLRILYAVKGRSLREAAKAELATDHEIEISDLKDSSTYKITVSGRDQYGNEATSDAHTYLTPEDTRPPKITDLVAEAATVGVGENSRGQIIVSWVTDEPAISQIEYGEGIEGDFYSSQTKEDSFLTKDHLVIVSDLDPAKPYHFRAVSKDRAGNPAYSSDNTAITGKAKKSVLQIIIETFQKSFGWLKGLGGVLGF